MYPRCTLALKWKTDVIYWLNGDKNARIVYNLKNSLNGVQFFAANEITAFHNFFLQILITCKICKYVALFN